MRTGAWQAGGGEFPGEGLHEAQDTRHSYLLSPGEQPQFAIPCRRSSHIGSLGSRVGGKPPCPTSQQGRDDYGWCLQSENDTQTPTCPQEATPSWVSVR